jgi:FixJ family two-component response regulator
LALANQPPIVHVVDDDAAFRVAIERLLRAAGFAVRTYSSADDFLVARPGETPGCVVLDLRMPGATGLDIQTTLARRSETLPVIFLSGRGDIPSTVKALKGGAVDFLTKPVRQEDLLAAIRAALAGDAQRRVDAEKQKVLRARYESQTPRERAVFERVVAGRLNKQIAHELGMAERTVKAHRGRVMEKMQAASLAELVRIADQLQATGYLHPAPKDDTAARDSHR